MANPQHFKEIYTRENPLQAMNATAAAIEKETGIAVINGHLGNPTAPQFAGTNRVLSQYYAARADAPMNTGYANVVGHEDWRRIIANALTRINRLPKGEIDQNNIIGANGGTGALNVAFQIFKNPTILVADPFYPPWMEISTHTKEQKIETYDLRREDSYLLNEDILSKKIEEATAKNPDAPVVLIYHYPHNPTGKTLTEDEAKTVGERLNHLCKKHPNLYLVQEDLYLATTASDMGIYTPLPHLDETAKARTLWIHSPSKMGHAQDRGAVIAAFNPVILKHLRGCTSFDTLGASHPSLLATANTLAEIATGGVEARGAHSSRDDNYRFQVADFYQDRLKIVADGIKDIEQKLGVSILPDGAPKGTYYLFPSFEFLKGKAIPEELAPAFNGKATFENADDVTTALKNAHLLGLQPITVGSGTLFTKNKDTMNFRLATIEPDIEMMHGAVNTLRGLAQKVMGQELGAYFHTLDELKENHPAPPPIGPMLDMVVGKILRENMTAGSRFSLGI
jgi:aspartate/methionine/tyrosine aminotransferase